MPVFPITRLFPGKLYTVAISGPNIQVLDTSTGDVRHKVTDSAEPVRCAAVDQSFCYLATAGDNKTLKIWEIEGLKLVNERELPKRPTSILFTADAKTILVSDKFGDVFRSLLLLSVRVPLLNTRYHSYTLEFTPLTEKQKKDALSSHENPSGGSLILGHTSFLNAFILNQDEKYIITADRDEHIRVSWYPQGYNIEMFCLGHTKSVAKDHHGDFFIDTRHRFVSTIHNPAFAPAELVSGGGDPTLKIWDWMAGTIKHEIPVWVTVEPYIRIRSSKRKREADSEDGTEVRRKGRGKKGKAKAKTDAADAGETPVTETPENAVAVSAGGPIDVEEKVEKVLVIHKIETTASRRIIFSVVGATALFSVDYPGNGAGADIHALELGQPVLDFVVAQDNRIWVTLDGNWADGTVPVNKCFVLVIELSESGELSKSTSESSIIDSLNSAALLPATEDDLKKLELYNDLVAMPKGYEAENDPDGDTAQPDPEKQSKKILGRLKNKQKVLEKERELAATGGDGVKEPDAKKAKSDVGDEQEDVDMAEAQ
ncbi:hypothetical protein C0995_014587 [Termitomyces sp. Mi166|nr:hypothetical protein C0995_014587 [Termitomyces sp. Mi166\